jgi:hypothetical protein
MLTAVNGCVMVPRQIPSVERHLRLIARVA